MLPDFTAEIKPGAELGGIRIGEPLKSYPELLSLAQDTRDYGLINPLVASYRYGGSALELVVDVSTGLIAKITAGDGYQGLLWKLIGVGSRCETLFERFPEAEFVEETGLLVFREVEGLSMSLDDDDPVVEDVFDSSIAYISVFSKVLLDNSGWRR